MVDLLEVLLVLAVEALAVEALLVQMLQLILAAVLEGQVLLIVVQGELVDQE